MEVLNLPRTGKTTSWSKPRSFLLVPSPQSFSNSDQLASLKSHPSADAEPGSCGPHFSRSLLFGPPGLNTSRPRRYHPISETYFVFLQLEAAPGLAVSRRNASPLRMVFKGLRQRASLRNGPFFSCCSLRQVSLIDRATIRQKPNGGVELLLGPPPSPGNHLPLQIEQELVFFLPSAERFRCPLSAGLWPGGPGSSTPFFSKTRSRRIPVSVKLEIGPPPTPPDVYAGRRRPDFFFPVWNVTCALPLVRARDASRASPTFFSEPASRRACRSMCSRLKEADVA